MKNQSSMNWRIVSNLIIACFIGFIIGFVTFKVTTKIDSIPQGVKYEIIASNITDNTAIKAKLDSLNTIRLENLIALVEKKNDGRFEVLTWSAVLVLTLLAAFITINFIISSAKVKEIVDIEIDRKTEDLRTKARDLLAELESKIQEFDNLSDEAEKSYNKTIEYLNEVKIKNK